MIHPQDLFFQSRQVDSDFAILLRQARNNGPGRIRQALIESRLCRCPGQPVRERGTQKIDNQERGNQPFKQVYPNAAHADFASSI